MSNIRIHIIRSADVTKVSSKRIVDYLTTFPGLMQFFGSDFNIQLGRNEPMVHAEYSSMSSTKYSMFFQPVNEKKWATNEEHTFPDFFEVCNIFRAQENIPDEDHVFLLTSIRNNLNWFSAADKVAGRKNYFIQMNQWEYFTMSDNLYPVAYQLATMVVKSYMFFDFSEYERARHIRPIGCMLDFCQRKKDISIKMRTADICSDCQQLMLERQVPNLLTAQTLRIMEGIRSAILFKERFEITRQAPGIWISENLRDVGVNDIGFFSFGLNPLEITLYRFFLNHPEGVQLSFLQDHRDEIYRLYNQNDITGSLENINSRINELIDPNSNSASEKISRIKRKITELLGTEMANELIIQGPTGEPKKILLDRSKVVQR